ncbi:hypothetical protein ACIQWL_10440 [Streptomyces mirabilis]|uniref:hypothetical protein n=1 Tax=Streptomyces mirabilis TaxID=68239 RepID=UPI000A815CDE
MPRLLACLPQIAGDPFDLAVSFQFSVAGGPAEHFSDPALEFLLLFLTVCPTLMVGLVVEGGLPGAAVGTDQRKERNP